MSNNSVTTKTGFQLHPEHINKEGRPPKEFSITNSLRELLSEKDPERKVERYILLIEKAVSMAMKGDGDMLKYLINRIEGVPKGEGGLTAVQINNVMPSREQVIEDVIMFCKQATDEEKVKIREVL